MGRKYVELSKEALNERVLQLGEHGCRLVEKATPYSYVVGEGWSRCSCGMTNVGCESCSECGLSFGMAEALEDEAFLLAAAAQRRKREEEAARKKEEHAAELKKKHVDGGLLPFLLALWYWRRPSLLAFVQRWNL